MKEPTKTATGEAHIGTTANFCNALSCTDGSAFQFGVINGAAYSTTVWDSPTSARGEMLMAIQARLQIIEDLKRFMDFLDLTDGWHLVTETPKAPAA